MEFFTKLKPLTSQTKECPFARRRSNPQTVCWKDVKVKYCKWHHTHYTPQAEAIEEGLSNPYLKCKTHFSGHKLFHCSEHDRIPNFFSFTISLHFPIQSRRLTSLCVSVIRSYSVNLLQQYKTKSTNHIFLSAHSHHNKDMQWRTHLYIGSICGHEFFIDVRASLPDGTFRRIHTTPAANLKDDRHEFCAKLNLLIITGTKAPRIYSYET